MITCPACGEENPERFKLCGFCGTPLPTALPAQEVRKTVTIVFCDLKGSTSLGESVDSETLGDVMNRYFDEMRAVLEYHGGTIEKFIGDAVMAVFGLPKLHEDDALRAVRAVAGMQTALATLNDELEARWGVRLENRIGVNTGEIVAGDADARQRLVIGDPVNVAARLEQAAGAMEALIGDTTYRLVRDAVDVEPVEPLELKGKSERVPAYRLLGVRDPAAVRPRREAAFVGRDEELDALEAELGTTVEERSARLVTVVAEPGLGKTRLTQEFIRRVGDTAVVLRGRCLPYGRGITFWPLVEMVRAAAGILEEDTSAEVAGKLRAVVGPDRDDVVERVAAAVGLADGTFAVAELFWGARAFLEAVAGERPLVVIVDDVHWAEDTLLELVEHLRTATRDRPLLLLCLGRDEFLQQRPDWTAQSGALVITLEPLGEGDADALVDAMLGELSLDDAARARIIQAADGNPLFVEQLVSMLLDEGASAQTGEAAPAVLELGAIPPTIHALLAARLDHVAPEERHVLEAASVVGLEFAEEAIRHLVPDQISDDVPRLVSSLERRRFLRPGGGGEDQTIRFAHILVKDAVYGAMLKRARASLHERFVGWADGVNRDRERATEFQEILGYHLEQAFMYLRDLGPIDDHGRRLAGDAAERLASAGRRAFARGDMPAAANLLRRAGDLLPEDDDARLDLAAPLGEAYLDIGELAWAQLVLEQGLETPRAQADDAFAARLELMHALVIGYAGTDDSATDAVAEAARHAIDVFMRCEDHGGLATAYRLLAWARGTALHFGDAAAAAQEAMVHAAVAGDERQRSRAAAQYAIAALHGPTPVPEAIERCMQILVESREDRRLTGVVTSLLAPLEAMRGEFDQARILSRSGKETLEELGEGVAAASTSQESSVVEFLAGDAAEAERQLRRDFEALERMGEKYLLSTIAGELARALVAQSRLDEALAMTATAEELSAEDDVGSQALWRSARAKILAERGELEEARRLASEAVELLDTGDAIVRRADALVHLAEVLEQAGFRDEAAQRLSEAEALLREKENTVALGTLLARRPAVETA